MIASFVLVDDQDTRKLWDPDIDIWNPWDEKTKSMTDMDDDEYKLMVCVQPGYVNQRYILDAGQTVTMKQQIVKS